MSVDAKKEFGMGEAMNLLQTVALRGGLEVAEKQVVLAVAEENPADYVAGLKAVQTTLAGVNRRIERLIQEALPVTKQEEYAFRKEAEKAAREAREVCEAFDRELGDLSPAKAPSCDPVAGSGKSRAVALGLNTDDMEKLDAALGEIHQLGAHVTIFKFTTHWKAVFGTPDLDGNESSRDWLFEKVPGTPSLQAALLDMLATRRKWPDHAELKALEMARAGNAP